MRCFARGVRPRGEGGSVVYRDEETPLAGEGRSVEVLVVEARYWVTSPDMVPVSAAASTLVGVMELADMLMVGMVENAKDTRS